MKTNPQFNVNEILYVGIDVSKDSNQVCILNFNQDKLASFSSPNNNDGAIIIEEKIISLIKKHSLKKVIIVLESTGIYSFHISYYLSSNESLVSANTEVFVVNPKSTANYSKVLNQFQKTDPNDAYALADFARAGHTKNLKPFNGSQRLALQRLTRHRKHVVSLLVKEKEYVLTNIFLKFSDYNNGNHDCKSFSNMFSSTSREILLKYDSPEKIAKTKLDKLVDAIVKFGKNRFSNPIEVANKLQKAARSSYRLDKAMYEPLNAAISSSLSLISCFENEINEIDKAIEKLVKGLDSTQYQSLLSIPGVGPVFAAGIFSEIGDINMFDSDNALAKFVGLIWYKHDSGQFASEDNKLTKAGNTYLRYYIVEATSSVINYNISYKDFYNKKFYEVTKHQHSRATILTARKFVRLIYSLMSGNKLYSKDK